MLLGSFLLLWLNPLLLFAVVLPAMKGCRFCPSEESVPCLWCCVQWTDETCLFLIYSMEFYHILLASQISFVFQVPGFLSVMAIYIWNNRLG